MCIIKKSRKESIFVHYSQFLLTVCTVHGTRKVDWLVDSTLNLNPQSGVAIFHSFTCSPIFYVHFWNHEIHLCLSIISIFGGIVFVKNLVPSRLLIIYVEIFSSRHSLHYALEMLYWFLSFCLVYVFVIVEVSINYVFDIHYA